MPGTSHPGDSRALLTRVNNSKSTLPLRGSPELLLRQHATAPIWFFGILRVLGGLIGPILTILARQGSMEPAQEKAGNSCFASVSGIEALVGVEPTVADLQSAALATWLRRLTCFAAVLWQFSSPVDGTP